jgi:hypothetical protein
VAYIYEAGKFSRERIFAVDGMAVTAEVWNAAHDYHRQLLSAYARYLHGNGIIEGLRVYAANPANPQSLHIAPGSAVDSLGRIIVNPETLTHNLSDQTGLVYLILQYDEESIVATRTSDEADGNPRYKRSEYVVRAVTELPLDPYVELARIRRNDLSTSIRDAIDIEQVGSQEIDLRFRKLFRTAQSEPFALALVSLDRDQPSQHWQGWIHLTRELRNTGVHDVWTQRNVLLDKNLPVYWLLCLSGQRNLNLNDTERHHLYQYIRNGGIVYFESCRRDTRFGEPGSDKLFLDMIQKMGGTFEEVQSNHSLYTIPHLFTRLPEAYEMRSTPTIQIATGIEKGLVIMSKNDYACLWNGDRRDRNATRTEMREAFEWGSNLLSFVSHHRQNL